VPVSKGIPLTLVSKPTPAPPAEFRQLLEWVGASLSRLEEWEDERMRDDVFALLDGVDMLHRQALGRLLETIGNIGGQGLVERVAQDPMVRSLLEMYDLPELDERAQVERALRDVHPQIETHGGTIEVLSVLRGQVRVRLAVSRDGCSGSSATHKREIERALRDGFPAFTELLVEEPPATLRQPLRVGRLPLRRPRWLSVGSLEDIAPAEMKALWPEGASILLVRLGGDVYAYRNGCPPGSPLALQMGRLEGTILICPWHGCRYDVRSGKRQDAEGKLEVLPVDLRGGEIRIAMGTEEVEPG